MPGLEELPVDLEMDLGKEGGWGLDWELPSEMAGRFGFKIDPITRLVDWRDTFLLCR